MKGFLVGKTFPSLPSPHKPSSPTTNFSHHRSHPSNHSHRFRRHRRHLALGISARGGRSIHRDHGAPIDSAVAAEHESCPAIITPAAGATAVIAARASEFCMQLSREGSGYGGHRGHHVPPPSHPRIFNNHQHHPSRPYRRRCHRYTRRGSGRRRAKKQGYVPETPSVTGEAVGGKQGPLPAKEGADRGESSRRPRGGCGGCGRRLGGGVRAPCTQWAPLSHRCRHRTAATAIAAFAVNAVFTGN